ncbi:hypothetical protein [Chitinophaga ginsengisegetis]|uniref:hypothetical protein n=1 Tax=Chitinophaga ginsengisegetis TaxID=393003 RepID=UPI000DB944C3|nr:hypothetical protein [Chitinophaga ginsengisegetis]MDR6570767.1 phosphoglycerol transferase MdoB-like AlkP superfamily enzyme [Chitinophaga ginsengisegetis]MDR6650501.1 phosphoglycerol transferase MdoB-like AlkP superfamily enzyme [Chitinophaga ginsengisegetis]MDR6656860.1 phosphoglycerol transferase MdoB-like AlkP superfamily enzyme [Chitinophaga ginsengisegetis]
MTLDTAKQIGRKYAVAAQLVTIIILELLWFFEEAGQDLANGLIFFIDQQVNLDVLLFFILLFGITYFSGGKAGAKIFNNPRRYLATGIKYALVISVIMIIYLLVVYLVHNGFKGSFYPVILVALLITISVIVAWLWASRQMMIKMKN